MVTPVEASELLTQVVIGQAPDYASARLPRGSALLTLPVVGPWIQRLASI